MLCSYGCGKEAKFKVGKQQKPCCEKNYSACPEFIRIAVLGRQKASQNRITNNIQYKDSYCIYCGKEVKKLGKGRHQFSCFLNPKNIKFCKVCGGYIKHYKNNITCSHGCANKLFKQAKGHTPHNKIYFDKVDYRKIARKHHQMKCVICGEDLMVDIHHYDNNHENNDPRNLVPVCPTHHRYLHCKNKYVIKECIDDYVKKSNERTFI